MIYVLDGPGSRLQHRTINSWEAPPVVVKQLSRHSLEQILALSSQGIVVADACDPELPIVYANPAYEKLTGYSADEVIGRGWRLLGPDAQEQPLLREITAAMGRSESCEIVFPDLRKDGTSWSSRISVHPLTNKRGDLEYYLCSQVAETTDRGSQGTAWRSGSCSVSSIGLDRKLPAWIGSSRRPEYSATSIFWNWPAGISSWPSGTNAP